MHIDNCLHVCAKSVIFLMFPEDFTKQASTSTLRIFLLTAIGDLVSSVKK